MMISDVLSKARRNKRAKRVGRGIGSGHGKTSTRGHKGLQARAGGSSRQLTEGGQMPLFRRIPKRGFNNAQFRVENQVVNVADLNEVFESGAKVTAVTLREVGLIANASLPVKVLGDGQIKKKLDVEANAFSKTAAEKITKAGGQARKVG